DLTHAACADRAGDLVGAEAGAWLDMHRIREDTRAPRSRVPVETQEALRVVDSRDVVEHHVRLGILRDAAEKFRELVLGVRAGVRSLSVETPVSEWRRRDCIAEKGIDDVREIAIATDGSDDLVGPRA